MGHAWAHRAQDGQSLQRLGELDAQCQQQSTQVRVCSARVQGMGILAGIAALPAVNWGCAALAHKGVPLAAIR